MNKKKCDSVESKNFLCKSYKLMRLKYLKNFFGHKIVDFLKPPIICGRFPAYQE